MKNKILICILISTLILISSCSHEAKEKIKEVNVYKPEGSGSMLPLIQPNSKIYAIGNSSNINTGDIIIFRSCENDLIVHRIYSMLKIQEKIYYITKGDFNKVIDNCLISNEMIEGKVIRIE